MGKVVGVVFIGELAGPREREKRSNVSVTVLGPDIISIVLNIRDHTSPA